MRFAKWFFCIVLVCADLSAFAKEARIVSLAPSLAEMASDVLGEETAQRQLVGTVEYSTYPPWVKKIPTVGSYVRFDLEKIVKLKPSLALAWRDGNEKTQVERLETMGIKTLILSTRTFEEACESYRLIGAALDREREGKEICAMMNSKIQTLKDAFKKSRRAKVFVQVSQDPLMTIGQASFLTKGLELIGAFGAFEDMPQAYPKPALEEVIKRKPSCVIYLASMQGKEKERERLKQSWSKFSIPTIIVDDERIFRPTLRFFAALENLGQQIHLGDHD